MQVLLQLLDFLISSSSSYRRCAQQDEEWDRDASPQDADDSMGVNDWNGGSQDLTQPQLALVDISSVFQLRQI